MLDRSLLVALLVGVAQGVLEWLPVSSEGNVALLLTALGESPEQVVAFALFVHLGTALSATAYYRGELRALVALLPSWRLETAFDGDHATVTFLVLGSLVSGLVGVTLYVSLVRSLSSIAGGTLVTLVGALLVLTGAFQYLSASDAGARTEPDWLDAVTVGVAQGVAILPGVSRSGMTTGTLLLRGHDATQSFRLSFLLSIPAAVGGGLLAYSDSTMALGTLAAGLSLGVAAVVGYLTIGALLRVVDELPFWAVCLGLGALVTLGGLLAV